jgi:hypothetical protein
MVDDPSSASRRHTHRGVSVRGSTNSAMARAAMRCARALVCSLAALTRSASSPWCRKTSSRSSRSTPFRRAKAQVGVDLVERVRVEAVEPREEDQHEARPATARSP